MTAAIIAEEVAKHFGCRFPKKHDEEYHADEANSEHACAAVYAYKATDLAHAVAARVRDGARVCRECGGCGTVHREQFPSSRPEQFKLLAPLPCLTCHGRGITFDDGQRAGGAKESQS